MYALRRPRKNWAELGRTVANGDNRRKSLPGKFRNGFRPLHRNIDSRLPHRLNRQRIYSHWLRPRAEHFIPRAAQMTKQSLAHLAARRVSRAQNEHARLAFRCGHLFAPQPQQPDPQHAIELAGFTARTNALMNFPSICGPTVSGSSPAAARKSRASSAL